MQIKSLRFRYRLLASACAALTVSFSSGTALSRVQAQTQAHAKTQPQAHTKAQLQSEKHTQLDALVPTQKQLRNFTYLVPRLSNGYDICTVKNDWYKQPGNYSVHFEQAAIGDLNHDGQLDAAVILDTCSGGTGIFGSLVVLINNGSKLVQLDDVDYPLGDRDPITGVRIENNKIVISKLERKENQSMADTPTQKRQIELTLRRLPVMQIIAQNSVDLDAEGKFRPCAQLDGYLAELSKQISTRWSEQKKEQAAICKAGLDMMVVHQLAPNHSPPWKMPTGIVKPVKISFLFKPNGSRDHVHNMALTASSGNDYWDNIASSALTTLSDLDEVPQPVAESPTVLKLECEFQGEKAIVKEIAHDGNQLTSTSVAPNSVRPNSGPPNSGRPNSGPPNSTAPDLAKKAKDFTYSLYSDAGHCDFYPLKDGRYKDANLEIECRQIATGDLNADGLADVAVHLLVTQTTEGKHQAINIISVLLNTGSGLTQAGNSNYTFESEDFPTTATAPTTAAANAPKLVADVTVQSLAILNGHIVSDWSGRKEGETKDCKRMTELAVYMQSHLDFSRTMAGNATQTLKAGAAALSKSLTNVWLEAIACAKTSPADTGPKVDGAPAPLKVRIVYDTEIREVVETQLLASSLNTLFDQTALGSLLSSTLASHSEEQDPACKYMVLDCTFAANGKTVSSSPAQATLGF